MKEMTIEEKAKAYDEAIERAKILYNDKNEIGYANAESVLEEVFPLLKESDDERIRKALIEYFNEQCDTSDWNGVYGYQVVAWLEKQGESYTKRDVDDAYLKGISDAKNELEKQGEQKSWSEEDEQIKERLIKLCTQYMIPDGVAITCENWLKSLRPQNTWKPSKEQMKAIEHICDGNYNVDLDILDSIYRDFKKLRKE